jgi:uncharacterized protein YyaL (SSP411 family)
MKRRLIAALLITFSAHIFASTEIDVMTGPRTELQSQQLQQALQAKGSGYQPRTEHLRDDGSPHYTNRLILEDSPYLVQHAHNPVDWFPWGEEAFAKAKRENKPIFLSIGYSTCHWCHVMERESFENRTIAKILNEHFIAIKVDRELLPDVDETYMTAVMMINGSGGWPMSSFLTPEGKPFYGATYFPPPQFRSLLEQVEELWRTKQPGLIEQADKVAEAVANYSRSKKTAGTLSQTTVAKAVQQALEMHDADKGGFSPAPKFPNENILLFLLNQAERLNDPTLLTAVRKNLDAMAQGGIYDQVAGGFSRYSVDTDWLVPHFEKMLYNQAHLSRAYLGAWRLTGDPSYRRVATQTFDYVLRDMTDANGGFYSATDADSEGEEGTFFLWSVDELKAVLTKDEAALAIELYGVTSAGNFEGNNILNLPLSLSQFATKNGLVLEVLYQQIDNIREKLYHVREKRIHPIRDEKILTAWNGMMISAFAQAGPLLNQPLYTEAARRSAEFIWQHNRTTDNQLLRSHLDGKSSIAASQEDYAFYAEGLLHLYDATQEQVWLERASSITDQLIEKFVDPISGTLYLGQDDGLTSMSRPHDSGTDGALPSGTAVALRSLQMLSKRTHNLEYRKQAQNLLAAYATSINDRPIAFAYLLAGVDDLQQGELGNFGYAAQGGIRASATLKGDKLTVRFNIPAGWHINSDKPLQDGLIATSLKLDDAAKGWELGRVSYPKADLTTLGFQSEALAVYHGEVQLEAALTQAANADRMLPVQLKLQACNDKVCLPPETLTLRLPSR